MSMDKYAHQMNQKSELEKMYITCQKVASRLMNRECKYQQSVFIKRDIKEDKMPRIYMRFPKGLSKAVTLSYDDGVEQDIRLIEIMKKKWAERDI